MIYDRQLLLGGVKRNAVLDLWEVQRYGSDSYGDADYVPAAIAGTAPHAAGTVVIDPFAGSGNTLYWILRHLPCARGLGFELDTVVFRLTSRNLAALASPVAVVNVDHRAGLTEATVPTDQLLITFIAPPWGDALSRISGLDLRRTTPPIAEIVDVLVQRFGQHRLLCAIQVYETVDPASLAELTPRFDWSALRVYDLNAPGENHGILLGTRGWVPSGSEERR